ncbi:MAG: IS3 family transposase [Gammaproteobacteria bacterium]|jgi:MinD superfamily P-loop ATPase|nr:IS3 family transposase [Gammaproteobacteria bacterium]
MITRWIREGKTAAVGRLQCIRCQICTTRAQVRSDVFDYIEMFYNTRRCHGYTSHYPR